MNENDRGAWGEGQEVSGLWFTFMWNSDDPERVKENYKAIGEHL